MNNAIRAALLSGLVLPGLGQVLLKRYFRGMVLILLALVSTGFIMVEAVQEALQVLERIAIDGAPVDIGKVFKAVSEPATAWDNHVIHLALLALIFCWISGVVDAIITGRKMDRAERMNQAEPTEND